MAKTETYLDSTDQLTFLDLVAEAVGTGNLEVHAYCLMPNHFHLLATTPEKPLGVVMQRILGVHAQRFNWRHERVGHLWQGRYKALLIEDDDYFLECSRYIHLNPVRAGLVTEPEQYRWSSYRTYVEPPTSKDWVAVDRTLQLFSHPKYYADFVEEEIPSEGQDPSEGEVFGRPRLADTRQSLQPAVGQPLRTWTLHRIQSKCDRYFPELSQCQRRRIMIYLLRHQGGMRPTQMARRLGRSPQAIHEAIRTVGSAIQEDPTLRTRIQRLL